MSVAVSDARAVRLALPALVVGAVAIGCSPILVRLSELGPTATGFHRLLLALPLLFLWMRRESPEPVSLRRTLPLLLPGLLFAGDLFFWHWSITLTTVANATLFANFAPIIVTLGAWLLLRERITAPFVGGMLLAIAGASLLVGSSFELGGSHVFGDVLGMITAIFFGAYMLSIARLRGSYGAATIMFWSGIVTCAALLPVALLSGESLLPSSAQGWLVLLALAWVSQAFGQGLIAYALGHLPASFSSLVILVEPLAAAILGWMLLGEALGPLELAGGAIVLAGILVARRAANP